MRLQNRTKTPQHSVLVNKTLNPGDISREISDIVAFFDDLKNKTRGFTWVFSEKEKDLITSLVEKYVLPEPEEQKYYNALHDDDPTGIRKMREMEQQARIAKQKAFSESVAKERERQARIQSETNYLDEAGNPVPDKVVTMAKFKEELKPVFHNDFGTDVKSVLENNLAVLAQSPLDDTAIMNRYGHAGDTTVSHDPEAYTKSK